MASILASFSGAFNSRLEPQVRSHLINVYSCLTMTGVSAAGGALVDMYTDYKAGFLSNIGALGLIMLLLYTPDTGKNVKQRLAYLLGFGFLSGISMGPLLQYTLMLNPSILITALTGTTLIFASFSISALLAERGRWLFLGGTLFTLLSAVTLLSLANIFFRSQLLYQARLYMGLVLMCCFILYDTQMIVEKRRMGDKDFINHALGLFIDFIGFLKRILILLAQKEEQNRRPKQN